MQQEQIVATSIQEEALDGARHFMMRPIDHLNHVEVSDARIVQHFGQPGGITRR
ncbi:hypothetical protein BJ965_001381 [Streptomyces luteogriseus]|uniref:Uncharacterized protein n=1 Tax=Streptomyces luteogriseus TaxID=68233 RepID=A0A7W7GFV5_9ACTN|nr:hypothetical protein [Streptomyces luteogriseus]